MTATSLPAADAAAHQSRLERVREAVAAVGAMVLGAAPHVLHHAGPLAGAAVLAGASGRLLFGAIGLVLTVPLLRRLHRRHGSWVVPGGVLALMAILFAVSTFVIGPAITGAGGSPSTPKPAGVSTSGHEGHHP